MAEETALIILGAGASGLAAAIAAGREGVSSFLIEKEEKAGRKIGASGNGRCNLGHELLSVEQYRSRHPDLLAEFLGHEAEKKLGGFFSDMGLPLRRDEAGRLYPYCEEAEAVRRTLLAEAERYARPFQLSAQALRLRRERGSFVLGFREGGERRCRRLILACGGAAAPHLGAVDNLPFLEEALTLKAQPFRPALTPLLLREKSFLKKATGARCKAALSTVDGRCACGEFLFTDYGISGIAAMELSLDLAETEGQFAQGDFYFDRDRPLYLDFFPDRDREDLAREWQRKARQRKELTWRALLSGYLHSRIADAVCADHPRRMREQGDFSDWAILLKHYPLTAAGLRGYKQAQLSRGGIPLEQLKPESLEFRKASGLYACGEILDISGNTGGYNLAWAWISGLRAGQAAAKSLLREG